MPQITKLTTIAGATIAASGIGAATVGLLPSTKEIVIKNTSNKLSNEGFEVLDTEQDNDAWKAVLEAYTKAEKNTFTGKKDEQRTNEDLRKECKKQLALSTDDSYKLARKWCVKEQSVTEILSKKNKVLTTTEAKLDESAIWAQNFDNLRKTTETKFSDLKEKISAVGTNEETLRKACEALKPNEIKTTSETFDDVFDKTREFCSKRNTK